MDNPTALRLLESPSVHDRLRAARFLTRYATPSDVPTLQRALGKENVSWIRNALTISIARALGTPSSTSKEASEGPLSVEISEKQVEEIYSNAMQEVTSQLLHEIEPLIGVARVYGGKEITGFEQSKTKQQLDRIDALLTAFRQLRKAATPSRPRELDLAALLREAKEQVANRYHIEVQLAGPTPFNVFADEGLLWLAFTNGLRNALESTEASAHSAQLPVVVNWGHTERDFWISIIDHGIGIKGSLDRIFDVGTTSKKGHVGMGLPMARQAARSLDGEITLAPRDEIGAKFEIRWPTYQLVT